MRHGMQPAPAAEPIVVGQVLGVPHGGNGHILVINDALCDGFHRLSIHLRRLINQRDGSTVHGTRHGSVAQLICGQKHDEPPVVSFRARAAACAGLASAGKEQQERGGDWIMSHPVEACKQLRLWDSPSVHQQAPSNVLCHRCSQVQQHTSAGRPT